MKTFLTYITSLLLATSLFAQQTTTEKISNSFIRPDNRLTDLKEINILNTKLEESFYGTTNRGLVDNSIDEIDNNSSYYRIWHSIPLDGSETNPRTRSRNLVEGLLLISWRGQTQFGTPKSIEVISKGFYYPFYQVNEEKDLVTEYIKNNVLDGSFIFSKNSNLISFVIVSKTKAETVRGTITINLPESERLTFAKSFIEKTTFEPTQGRTRNGTGGSTGTRTDSTRTRTGSDTSTGGSRTRTGSDTGNGSTRTGGIRTRTGS